MTSQLMQCVMHAYQAVPMQHKKQLSGGFWAVYSGIPSVRAGGEQYVVAMTRTFMD